MDVLFLFRSLRIRSAWGGLSVPGSDVMFRPVPLFPEGQIQTRIVFLPLQVAYGLKIDPGLLGQLLPGNPSFLPEHGDPIVEFSRFHLPPHMSEWTTWAFLISYCKYNDLL